MVKNPDMLRDRDIDQLIMCAIYVMSKVIICYNNVLCDKGCIINVTMVLSCSYNMPHFYVKTEIVRTSSSYIIEKSVLLSCTSVECIA